MANVENIVIEHLKAVRAGQDRIEMKLSEIGTRLTSLDAAVLKSRSDNLGTQEHVHLHRDHRTLP